MRHAGAAKRPTLVLGQPTVSSGPKPAPRHVYWQVHRLMVLVPMRAS